MATVTVTPVASPPGKPPLKVRKKPDRSMPDDPILDSAIRIFRIANRLLVAGRQPTEGGAKAQKAAAAVLKVYGEVLALAS